VLVNARHVKQLPGPKTDVSDAEWLCRPVKAGLLKASFVPPKPIRQLRNLTRYRKTQIQERSRQVNRLHKALEDAGIKLDCVAADIMGKPGRDMLDALVRDTTDPQVLADLARRQMRKKIPALREALEGRFDAHHALWIGAILAHIDFLDEQIDRLSDAIEEQIRPFARAVELLCTINDQSAGKRRSGKTRDGSKWLDYALEEAAMAAIRVKANYLAANTNASSPGAATRRPWARSNTRSSAPSGTCSPPARPIATSAATTSSSETQRQTKRLVKQLERLRHHVTLHEAAPA
jgi:transposase